jgi:hypothetical protein
MASYDVARNIYEAPLGGGLGETEADTSASIRDEFDPESVGLPKNFDAREVGLGRYFSSRHPTHSTSTNQF